MVDLIPKARSDEHGRRREGLRELALGFRDWDTTCQKAEQFYILETMDKKHPSCTVMFSDTESANGPSSQLVKLEENVAYIKDQFGVFFYYHQSIVLVRSLSCSYKHSPIQIE